MHTTRPAHCPLANPAHRPARRAPALPAVPGTLLIPLAARAAGDASFPALACGDAEAPRLLDSLGADAGAFLADRPTMLNILWRTRHIRAAGQAFFTAHPQAWGINLGCGLSHYFQWLDNGRNTWVDVDLPEVMALRRTLLPPRGVRLRHARLDLCSPRWWHALHLPPRALEQPVFAVCEGVLMYLPPAQAHAVLEQFAAHSPPGSRLVIDTLTRWAVGHAGLHPSVGRTGAEFLWGVSRMDELASCHPRLRLERTHSVAECYGWMGSALEAFWRPWIGAPLYGLAELSVQDT